MQIVTALALALAGAAFVAVDTAPASAAVVCNSHGDCWRTEGRPRYPGHLRLRVMPDNWQWRANEGRRYRWRDAGPGRGYYRNGVWVTIR